MDETTAESRGGENETKDTSFSGYMKGVAVKMASWTRRMSAKIGYYVFMGVLIIVSVCLLIVLIGGATTLAGVMFGKVIAGVTLVAALLILLSLPVMETFKDTKDAVRQEFNFG